MRFEGERLRVTRTLRDMKLQTLADRVGSSVAVLSKFENNRREPSSEMVAAIARELGFEEIHYYKPIIEEFTQKECSFRKKSATTQRVRTRVLAKATLLGDLVRELQKVVRFPAVNVPRFADTWGMEAVEEAAKACREHWGFGEGPIQNMVRVLEHAGIFVVCLHAEDDDVDAFARVGDTPFVVINDAKNSSSRAKMDMAHELGHLVMHAGATEKEEEDQANRFGAAFLLPAGAFGRSYLAMGRNMDWLDIFDLKRKWGVSAAMIVRRAYDLGLSDAAEYQRRNRYIRYRGWHKGEPFEPATETPEMLFSAINVIVKREGGLSGLLERLGWSEQFFYELTGYTRFAQSAQADVIPVTTPRLALM